MASGWGPLAGVCAVLLLLAGASQHKESQHSSASTAQAIVDPSTARYDNFNPADASLKLVQVVFRHGARTPLNDLYNFRGVNWTHCRDHYQGLEVELYDENGAPQPPPILDPATPELPGGCRQGTLTEAGYQMALDVGTWLRNRYVVSAAGSTGGYLPDLGPEALPTAAAVTTTTTSGGGGGGGDTAGSWNSAVARLRTTPIRRTVATLRGVLTGLWPRLVHPPQQQALRGALGTGATRPALPVGASLENLEIMYGNNRTCARLGPLHEAMQRDLDAADSRDAELPRLNRLVAEALGLDPERTTLWPKLYDHLAAMIADGAPMPAGATREVLDVIWAQAERHEAGIIAPSADLCASLGPGGADGSSARERRCREVLRLGIGMLVRRLLDNMEATVMTAAEGPAAAAAATAAQSSPSLLYLFSGHDSSLMPLLAVLGQPARVWPPFASHLVFELWQTRPTAMAAAKAAMGRRGIRMESGAGSGSAGRAEPQYWVRLLYNGAPLVVPALSSTDGWVPLGLLRQRVLLPYAIGPAEHAAVCSRMDISDLEEERAPTRSNDWAAAAARERLLRHATL